MPPDRDVDPPRRAFLMPGPIALGVLGWALAALAAVSVLTVGIAPWLAYVLFAAGLLLMVIAIMWGVARGRTHARSIRWRGEP